ncbi:MAG TPA: SDR family oxidoreductase [Azospira sp.]|nr:SDR family oxidoreductase [Azospira sp.]
MRKIVLITGGSGKFGRVLVRHFLAAGDTVVTTCRSDASLASLQHEHEGLPPGRFHVIQVDLTRPDQAEYLVDSLKERGLAPTCLINNARSVEYLANGEDGRVSRDNFMGEFLMDVVVPYELTMALVGCHGSAVQRVVNIGSMYGLVAANPSLYVDPIRQSPLQYGVAKAALVHLTKELSVRLASRVAVNCVAYGGVEGRVDEAFKARYGKLCPAGRMLREDEIPGPVAWLLSDACSGMTGQTLAVDGGWSVW